MANISFFSNFHSVFPLSHLYLISSTPIISTLMYCQDSFSNGIVHLIEISPFNALSSTPHLYPEMFPGLFQQRSIPHVFVPSHYLTLIGLHIIVIILLWRNLTLSMGSERIGIGIPFSSLNSLSTPSTLWVRPLKKRKS